MGLIRAGLRVWRRGDQNVREVVSRLNQIELGAMGIVVIRDVLLGHIDFGSDLLVQDFFGGERAPDVALEVVERELTFLQALIELLRRVRRLDFGQLAINLFIRRQQAKLLGAMHQDFVFDEFAQNAEPQAGRLFVA